MVSSLFLEPVTDNEIKKNILSLKNGAPGYDGVTAQILKSCVLKVKQPLSYLCNRSLTEGIFPREMKIANINSGDPILFDNHLPWSLLCVLSEFFKKVMYSRLLNFLNHYKVLISNQFGFRKSHSSFMALMVMINESTNALENGDYVIGIFLDFSKAFDTVNHKILLDKLYHYDITDNALQWFQSYLTERQQFVTYNGVSSHKKTIKCGVPQDSILGPLLFLVYINNLYHICKKPIPILFADDTNLFFRGTDLKLMESEINTGLDHFSLWLKVNKLSLNIKKTNYMIFNRKKKCCCDVMLRIEKKLIEEVSETKFLGVIIDNGLKWNKHIQHTSKKKYQKVSAWFSRQDTALIKNALITLCYSFIYPYMTYCNHIWSCSAASNINKISVLQKKVILIICRMKPRDSCEPMYSALGIMRFSDVNVHLISNFMFRVCKGGVPKIFRT